MFAELHQLARAASLLISIAAEGDNLRVTINATSTSKSGPAVHPLVLVGTPEEIDAGFADAVQIFEPSALPLLDQARAAANANGNKGGNALKAPKTTTAKEPTASAPSKRGPGRPSNAEKEAAAAAAAAEKNCATNASEPADDHDAENTNTDTPLVDPRQMSLVEPTSEGTDASTNATPAAPTQAEQTAGTDPRDAGIDMPI